MADYIIKNTTHEPLRVGSTTLSAGQQLTVHILTPEILEAQDRGLSVREVTLTHAERHADVLALKPFKVGDPAIDG